jgi:DNA-binding FadR family transcriptional regulator
MANAGDDGDGDRRRSREKPQQIADELRHLIVSGALSEGDSLGHESDLVERFGVSRPSLREALRILEAEGLITVVRGVLGGVVVHEPDERMTARTAAVVLQSRNVSLADVYDARSLLELTAVRVLASARSRRASAGKLRASIREQERAIEDPAAFGPANARFHEQLVELAGNLTLTVIAETLNEIVTKAVIDVGQAQPTQDSIRTRRRGVHSQERLVELIERGEVAAAEQHWRKHMAVAGRVLLGPRAASAIVDLTNHY